MAKKASTGLGRGLDVLIPKDFDEAILTDVNERVQNLFISEIYPNPEQPRRTFDANQLEGLAASIKRYGVLQPLIVSPDPGGNGYVIVAGERRWRAATSANLKKVPAIVRKREELEQLEVALIENVQRVDLSPLEQAVSIEKLHQQFNLGYQEIADRLGKAHSTVHNIVRLLHLPESAKKALQELVITEGHARAILALKDKPQQQEKLLQNIIKNNWTVRQAEQFVTSTKQGLETPRALQHSSENETPQTKQLGQKLQTKVTIKRTARGGRLEIHYKNEENLQQILRKLDVD